MSVEGGNLFLFFFLFFFFFFLWIYSRKEVLKSHSCKIGSYLPFFVSEVLFLPESRTLFFLNQSPSQRAHPHLSYSWWPWCFKPSSQNHNISRLWLKNNGNMSWHTINMHFSFSGPAGSWLTQTGFLWAALLHAVGPSQPGTSLWGVGSSLLDICLFWSPDWGSRHLQMLIPAPSSSPWWWEAQQGELSPYFVDKNKSHGSRQSQDMASPPMTLFHSLLFVKMLKEKKISVPGRGHCVYGVRKFSPWIFCGDSGFLPHPKDVHVGWIFVSQFSQWSGCGFVCEWPCDGSTSCSGCPPCAPSYQDRLQPPAMLNWNKHVRK